MIAAPFSEHFMVNAFEAGTVVAVVAGAAGWFMVLRRESFAGHTLAVVSFPGAAAALWAGVGTEIGYFGASVAAALVIAVAGRRSGISALAGRSAVIGTVQAFALACGALFVSLYGGFLNSVTGLLFGTSLGVSDRQVLELAVVGATILAVLAAVGRPLLFATVDPDVARARGVPVTGLGALFLVLLGATAAEASQITGALLVFALLVMPAATAQRLSADPRRSLGMSVLLALVFAWGGLLAAYYSDYPVGFTVTTLGIAALAAATGYMLLGRRAAQALLGRGSSAP